MSVAELLLKVIGIYLILGVFAAIYGYYGNRLAKKKDNLGEKHTFEPLINLLIVFTWLPLYALGFIVWFFGDHHFSRRNQIRN